MVDADFQLHELEPLKLVALGLTVTVMVSLVVPAPSGKDPLNVRVLPHSCPDMYPDDSVTALPLCVSVAEKAFLTPTGSPHVLLPLVSAICQRPETLLTVGAAQGAALSPESLPHPPATTAIAPKNTINNQILFLIALPSLLFRICRP